MAEDVNNQQVYITKYALTQGIKQAIIKKSNNYEFWTEADRNSGHVYRKGDFFETLEEAKKDAKGRRLKEIVRLNKHLNKIMDLSFE